MKEKFDVVIDNVSSINIGPVEAINDELVFDIRVRTKDDESFSLRCKMIKERLENSGIFYFGLKGKENE